MEAQPVRSYGWYASRERDLGYRCRDFYDPRESFDLRSRSSPPSLLCSDLLSGSSPSSLRRKSSRITETRLRPISPWELVGSKLASLLRETRSRFVFSPSRRALDPSLKSTPSNVQLALLPTVNQMSVIGLISIPGESHPLCSGANEKKLSLTRLFRSFPSSPSSGLMTGAVLGGSSVNQAGKLQMILMFSTSSFSPLLSSTSSPF